MLTPPLNTRHSPFIKPLGLPSSIDSSEMETKICAQELSATSLKTKLIIEVCQENVDGLCPRPDLCEGDHRICQLSQDSKPKVQAVKNYLSLRPRPKIVSFEDDGPGNYSSKGARHDNDSLRIKDIQILPTTDEVLSLRPPYLPFKDADTRSFLAKGFSRHVDCLFRQLRHDNTEGLKDISYHAAQQLAEGALPPHDLHPRQETPNGNMYSMFWDVRFEGLLPHEKKGLMVRVSFACPPFLKGRHIHKSGHLESGMMAALVGLDESENALSVTFFETHLCESTDSVDSTAKSGDLRAGVQLSFAQKDNTEDIRRMIYYSQKVLDGRFLLVEFPRVLLAGFSWCLQNLQQLQQGDVSFKDYIAPPQLATVPSLKAPEYAKEQGFQFDLGPISKDSSIPLRFSLNDITSDRNRFLSVLERNTTLDEGQAKSLIHSLTSNLAFTQGPPGTGKTFLGVALTKTIIASTPKQSFRPIITVCMTNHALDSFLSDLAKDGISKITRIGGGSKDPSMGKFGLKANKTEWTDAERSAIGKAKRGVEHFLSQLTHRSKGLKGSKSEIGWFYIQQYLEERHPNILAQLDGIAADGLDLPEFAAKAEGYAYEFWSKGGDLDALRETHSEFSKYLDIKMVTDSMPAYELERILQEFTQTKLEQGVKVGEANIWRLSLMKRQHLVQQWITEIDQGRMHDELVEIHCRLQRAVKKLKDLYEGINVRCLKDKQVIGMTTTGCAMNFSLLSKLEAKVCICEEAGEVIEPHSLCTMFPTLQHSIFIGDPLQLRPQVNEKVLSIETSNAYRLDESLFERFMNATGPGSVGTSRLTVQRRMHPDISEHVRQTLYPDLKDEPSTHQHPPVADLATRTYWFDHEMPENVPDPDSPYSKSFSNDYEVEMATALVQHLVSTNAYGLGDIAILTPYNGQLAALMENLRGKVNILLSEKDRQALFDDGLISDEDETSTSRVGVDVKDMLRIASVDNFQGEEAKVVILTTVRSNLKGRVGFLKIENRINVACSRARDGFYVIGNSKALQTVPMWAKIISIFRAQGRLGRSLRTCCSRHPDHHFEIHNPKDFSKVQKCDVICGQTLQGCGHPCAETCHPEGMHEMLQCSKTFTIKLNCGHEAQITCKEQMNGYVPRCRAVVIPSMELPCTHTIEVRCRAGGDSHTCTAVCNTLLKCGHPCQDKCVECRASECHATCSSACGKQMPCGHDCDVECHSGSCPPCKQRCQHSCAHGQCRNPCNMVCDPCVKPCAREGCTLMCCLPCNVEIEISDEVTIEDSSFDVNQFKDILDRMIAKMGRKLDANARRVERERLQLRDSSTSFLETIRPNPMAAKQNKRMVKERLNSLDEVQVSITNFRDQVVISFEQNMTKLRNFDPVKAYADYNFQFELRFDILYYKARNIVLEETWGVSKQLATLKGDPSLQTSEFAEALRQIAIQDSEKIVKQIKEGIAKCAKKDLASAEVELHVLLLQFLSLIQRAKKSGSPDLSQFLHRATFLCRAYPDTSGKHLPHLSLLRQAIQASRDPEYPKVNEGRKQEAAWGSYQCGSLITCVYKHAYSAKSFEGCPECGRKVEATQQGFDGNYEQHLNNEAFLQRIRDLSPTSRTKVDDIVAGLIADDAVAGTIAGSS